MFEKKKLDALTLSETKRKGRGECWYGMASGKKVGRGGKAGTERCGVFIV